MAKMSQITIGEKLYMEVDSNPHLGLGLSAPVGSIAVLNNAGVGSIYFKDGEANTAWSQVSSGLDLSPYLKHDGTVAMTGDLQLGLHKITHGISSISFEGSPTTIKITYDAMNLWNLDTLNLITAGDLYNAFAAVYPAVASGGYTPGLVLKFWDAAIQNYRTITTGVDPNATLNDLMSFAGFFFYGFNSGPVISLQKNGIDYPATNGNPDTFKIVAVGGIDANSTKISNLSPGTASTDAVNFGQLGSESSARDAAIALEITARMDADLAEVTARDAAIAIEATARYDADLAEITARNAAIAAEATARSAADLAEVTARNAAILSEVTARNAAIAAEATLRQAAVDLKVSKSGDTMTGDLNMGSNKVILGTSYIKGVAGAPAWAITNGYLYYNGSIVNTVGDLFSIMDLLSPVNTPPLVAVEISGDSVLNVGGGRPYNGLPISGSPSYTIHQAMADYGLDTTTAAITTFVLWDSNDDTISYSNTAGSTIVAVGSDLDIDSHKIVNVAAGTASTDAVNFGQLGSESTARNAAIALEATARSAADLAEITARNAAIAVEATARADADLAEVTARNAAIAAEATLRYAADLAEVTARNSALDLKVSKSGDTMTGNLEIGQNKITDGLQSISFVSSDLVTLLNLTYSSSKFLNDGVELTTVADLYSAFTVVYPDLASAHWHNGFCEIGIDATKNIQFNYGDTTPLSSLIGIEVSGGFPTGGVITGVSFNSNAGDPSLYVTPWVVYSGSADPYFNLDAGSLNINTNKIINVVAGTESTDAVNYGQLLLEITARTNADLLATTARDSAILEEVTARIAGDLAEITARNAAILVEVTARQGADSELQASIDALTSNLNWRPGCVAATADADLASAVDGTELSTLLPFSDDDAPVMASGGFEAGQFIISKNGTSSKVFKIVLDGVLKVTTVGVDSLVRGDTFVVQNDFPATPNENETVAIYSFTGLDIVRIGTFAWNLATGINLNTFIATPGVIVTNDTVQAAIQKLAGNLDSYSLAEITARQNAINSEITARMDADLAEATARANADLAEVTARVDAINAEATLRYNEDLTFFKKDGSREMTGNIQLGVYTIKNGSQNLAFVPAIPALNITYGFGTLFNNGVQLTACSQLFSALAAVYPELGQAPYSENSGIMMYIGGQMEWFPNDIGNISDAFFSGGENPPIGSNIESMTVYVTWGGANTSYAWVTGGAASFKLDAGSVDISSNKIINVAAGTVSTDAVNLGQLGSETSARNAAIALEVTARMAADLAEVTARNAAIALEYTARSDADLAEITARNAAISVETTARIAGDLAEITARNSALLSYVKHDGSVAMTGDLDLGGFKITSLEAGTASGDAATFGQLTDAINSDAWHYTQSESELNVATAESFFGTKSGNYPVSFYANGIKTMGMSAGNTLIENTLVVGSNTQISESVAQDSLLVTTPKANISISSPTNKILMQPGSLRLDFSSTAKIYNYAKTFDSGVSFPITLSGNSFKIVELILGVTFVTGGVDKVACYKKTLVAYGNEVSLMQDDFTMIDPYLRGFYLDVTITGNVLTATLNGTFPSYDSVTAKMKVVEI